jgi:tRNA dimethylallyltransferase
MIKEIYFVIGPTSSGKTALSVELAKKVEKGSKEKGENKKAEIVCCDSRQIYIDLDIGSGKATKEEMEGIPHHMLSVVEPGKIFTVVDYVNMALQKIKEVESRGNIPIISGGTGFYIDALMCEYNLPNVPINKELRNGLENKSIDELWEKYVALCSTPSLPRRGAGGESLELKNNRNRVIRYIEIITALGTLPPLKKIKRFKDDEYEVHIIKTNVDRKTLKERIYTRTIQRLKDGMLEEFQNIVKKYNLSKKYITAMGYEFRLMNDLFQNKIDEKTFLEEFVRQEYQYARRQDTWFRRYKN